MNYFQYYGIDWIATLFTFSGIWQIGNKNRVGFVLMMCGCTNWIIIGYLADSMAMVTANIIFFLMNLHAVIKWSKSDAGINTEIVTPIADSLKKPCKLQRSSKEIK